jgi:hypothetical protein
MPNPMQHVYTDTQYLHASIFPITDDEIIAKSEFDRVLNNRNSQILIKLPFVVVGETVNNIHRDNDLSETDKADIIRNLLNIMGNDKVDMCPPTVNCFELAKRLVTEDNRLDDTDSLIVAHALCDIYSSLLLMRDKKVLASAKIDEINKELYESGKRHRILHIRPNF